MKSIVTPSFLELIYEVEKAINEGYEVSKTHYPSQNFTFYEVVMEIPEKTVEEKVPVEATPAKPKAGRPAKAAQ